MAEKGFGVKEINLIGASGTPTIESPNNLNLNAVNVAISTNATVGGTLSVTGNVSVGGTLTYEDVTNIDSVGLITARSGVKVSAGSSINIGIAVTLSDGSNKGDLCLTGVSTAQRYQSHNGYSMDAGAYNNGYYINSSGNTILGMAYFSNNTIGLTGNGSSPLAFSIDDVASVLIAPKTGNTRLQFAESTKLETTNTGVTVTGTLAATAVTGDGSGLTSLPAATPTNSDIQVVYTVTANGSSAYRFAGNGVVSTADDPDLYLIRGQKYRFINNSGGSHPFQIREASGGTAYSTGVTNNGAASGNIDFAPTYDSPAQLVYQCTSHGSMVGNIYLRDAAGGNTNVGVTTFNAGINVNGNLTQTGSGNIVHYINTGNNSGDNSTIAFGDSADVDAGHINYDHGTNAFQIRTNGASNSVIITNEGEMQLSGDANPVLSVNRGGSNTTNINIKYNGSTRSQLSAASNGFEISAVGSTAPIQFFANGTEKVRIPAATWGLLVTSLSSTGNTGGYQTEGVSLRTGGDSTFVRTGNPAVTFTRKSDAGKVIDFYSGTTYAGGIYVNGSNNTALQQGSDYRLKTDITSMTDGINKVKQLNPIYYKANSGFDTTTVQNGFLAHEVQSVLPTLVDGEKDAPIDEKGKGYQTLNYAGFTPTAIAAIKELIAKVETLESKVAALEGS